MARWRASRGLTIGCRDAGPSMLSPGTGLRAGPAPLTLGSLGASCAELRQERGLYSKGSEWVSQVPVDSAPPSC